MHRKYRKNKVGESKNFAKMRKRLHGITCSTFEKNHICFSFYRATARNAMHGIVKAFLSVRRYVCLSVCQTRGLWQNERNLCPHSYTTWKIIHPSFLTKRVVGGGDRLYLKFWAKLTLLESKRRFSVDIRL